MAAAATGYEEEVGTGTGRTSTDHACTADLAGMEKYLVCLLVCVHSFRVRILAATEGYLISTLEARVKIALESL